MDRVTIMLQNKQLIEELINSSEDTKAKIHAAIIDGVSRRIVKNVVTNMDSTLKGAIEQTIEQAQNDLMKKFMEDRSNGWSTYYQLKKKYVQEIEAEVSKAWLDEISKSVKEYQENVAEIYEKRLQRAYDEFIVRIQTLTSNLDDKIQEAVDKNIRARFK